MAGKKVHSVLKNPLLWRFGLWGLVVFCLLMAGVIWVSGHGETKDAFKNGRRLIIHLDTGNIEGKQMSLEPLPPVTPSAPESPAATVPESPPAVTAAAPESPTESLPETTAPAAAESPPAIPAVAPESPEALPATPSSPLSVSDFGAVKPAAVPLAPVNEALLERTTIGALPMISATGQKPWRYHAKPYQHKGNLPTIAILITGLGQNRLVSNGAIQLPENISLSFSPYARDLASWTNAARIAGHEVLIDLPLEPSNFPASDPGPYGLLVGKGTQENTSRMQWLMSRVPGYVGFVTPPNEIFSANDAAFKSVLELLSSRGLMVVMEHEPARNETKVILETSNIPYTIADVRLDEELSPSAIQARLSTLEKLASKRGYAIGIAQPFPLTIEQLGIWAAELEKSGYTLVPITFITSLKFPS